MSKYPDNIDPDQVTIIVTMSKTGKKFYKLMSGKLVNEAGKPVTRWEEPDAWKCVTPNASAWSARLNDPDFEEKAARARQKIAQRNQRVWH